MLALSDLKRLFQKGYCSTSVGDMEFKSSFLLAEVLQLVHGR